MERGAAAAPHPHTEGQVWLVTAGLVCVSCAGMVCVMLLLPGMRVWQGFR
jgi:hypothetical protein